MLDVVNGQVDDGVNRLLDTAGKIAQGYLVVEMTR